MSWQPIDTAPRDIDILVWFDHSADPYLDPSDPSRLTSYGAWADGGDFMDGSGICVAKWFESTWENEDEYGGGYHMPAWWFAKNFGEYECSVNPTHWMPLPGPPENFESGANAAANSPALESAAATRTATTEIGHD